MPVYAVGATLRSTNQNGFFESWTRAIKGPYDHVEIAFVNGRTVYSCYITRSNVVARFEKRDYARFYLQCETVDWYHLPAIDQARQLELERFCSELTKDGKLYMSAKMMMMSCFPFENDALIQYWHQFAEPPSKDKKFEVSETAKRMAWKTYPRMTFCGDLSARILGFSRPEKRSASDVIVLCQRHLGAVKVDKPILEYREGDYAVQHLRDEANIVRSSYLC